MKKTYWVPISEKVEDVGVTTEKPSIYLFERKWDAEDFYGLLIKKVKLVDVKVAAKNKNK